jgi:hypothetical protein
MRNLHMLTTNDNPFNPVTQYDEWELFDEAHGYYTPALLARITISSDELSETDQDEAMEDAIDQIIKEDILNLYKKVSSEMISSGT